MTDTPYLALVRAMLHTSSKRREECQVEPEKTLRERAEDLISLLVPDWRPTPRQSLWIIRIGVVLGLLFAIGYTYGVTLWDWIKLLIAPAVIAAGGLWFNAQQRDLSDADLNYVILGEANLSGANLRGADLSNAILFNTDLTDADLSDATVSWWGGLNSCKSLKGATKPNGQKYEDWIMSKDRAED
jgi:hypothetical protein